ncbi:TPA: nucleoside 2-deoxyribosyltransferase [Pseudomonas aeruginosa]|nr:nucleoside 2-deoxyribosyltransferase [Pseudomonas aeruginosa]
MSRSNGSSSRRTFLRLAALLLPAGALLGSLPGVRAAARPRKLYLAGPDVFRADAVAHGEALKALCARYGFEGLYPLDNALPKQLAEPREQAAWIYHANIGLIERADAVLANLNFFRGAEPDSGTAFEVGYATALGKPVYGYVDDAGSYAERIRRHAPELVGEDPTRDRDGMALEEFGLPLNLMLAVPGRIVVGDAEQALRQFAGQSRG